MPGVFICLGVAADDIFVFLEAFDGAMRSHPLNTPIEIIVHDVLRDAGVATLVTSLTTAGAFLSCCWASVTSIRCFGLFCGIIVLSDWLLVVSAVPALAVLYNRYIAKSCGTIQSNYCLNTPMVGTWRHLSSKPLGQRFEKVLAPIITGSAETRYITDRRELANFLRHIKRFLRYLGPTGCDHLDCHR